MGRSSLQRRRRRNAIGLLWDVLSVASKYVKYAGQRGMINNRQSEVVLHKVYEVIVKYCIRMPQRVVLMDCSA
jgi:hypothetical protein